MKILVVSDTHALFCYYDRVLKKEYPFDMVIHCGDVNMSLEHVQTSVQCPLYIVQGNSDYSTKLKETIVTEIDGVNVVITHGHKYEVEHGLERLLYLAKENDAQVVLFGHLHKPILEEIDGVTFVNPGSLALPRQENNLPTYTVMNIEDGEVSFEMKTLE